MGYFIFWVICGFICSMIAGGKGRSAGGFFFLGLILGPIGVVIAAFTPRNEQQIEKESIQSGTMKKCPMCAEMIKREAIKCRHCGSELEGPPEASIVQNKINGANTNNMDAKCSCGHLFSYPVIKSGSEGLCPGCQGSLTYT